MYVCMLLGSTSVHAQLEYPPDYTDWSIDPAIFPEHSRESPSFDYPPNFINIDGSTASLSFKAHDVSTDSVQYTTDQSYYEGTLIPLPSGFHFDSTNAILSWDTTMTGKYLINIGVIRNISGQIDISATYRTVIIDTDMDNTLYVPVSTNAIEQAKFGIKLHPNPTQNQLTISTEKPLDEIRIYNQLGQLMWQENSISSNQFSVDVSGFSSGIYVVQVRQGAVWQSERFVKE